MTREEKNQVIEDLAKKLEENPNFYLADISELTVEDSNSLRGIFHEKGIRIEVVKNTLLRQAMDKVEGVDYAEIYNTLVGPTSIMFTEVGSVPAKLIKEYRKKHEKPILKSAFVEESTYIGDNMLEMLSTIKSKDELLGDIIALLQSPAKNVVSGLKSSGGTLAGILKTLSEREN